MSMWKTFKSVVARAVPFDNASNGFDSTDVQSAIEEIGASASPGFNFGRSGNINANTWLLITGTVPSNKTGITVALTGPSVAQIYIGNEDVNTFDVQIYEHEGNEVNLTLLGTVSVVSARSGTFTVSYTVTQGRQLAVKVSSGSAKNLSVGLQLKGSV